MNLDIKDLLAPRETEPEYLNPFRHYVVEPDPTADKIYDLARQHWYDLVYLTHAAILQTHDILPEKLVETDEQPNQRADGLMTSIYNNFSELEAYGVAVVTLLNKLNTSTGDQQVDREQIAALDKTRDHFLEEYPPDEDDIIAPMTTEDFLRDLPQICDVAHMIKSNFMAPRIIASTWPHQKGTAARLEKWDKMRKTLQETPLQSQERLIDIDKPYTTESIKTDDFPRLTSALLTTVCQLLDVPVSLSVDLHHANDVVFSRRLYAVIVENVIRNAQTAFQKRSNCDEGEILSIHVFQHDDPHDPNYLNLVFRDNGIGIDTEEFHFQLGKSTTGSGNGGYAIDQQMHKLSGGEFFLRKSADGKPGAEAVLKIHK